jgi:hypothetical protein
VLFQRLASELVSSRLVWLRGSNDFRWERSIHWAADPRWHAFPENYSADRAAGPAHVADLAGRDDHLDQESSEISHDLHLRHDAAALKQVQTIQTASGRLTYVYDGRRGAGDERRPRPANHLPPRPGQPADRCHQPPGRVEDLAVQPQRPRVPGRAAAPARCRPAPPPRPLTVRMGTYI